MNPSVVNGWEHAWGGGLLSETKEAGLSLADRADDLAELNSHLVAVWGNLMLSLHLL